MEAVTLALLASVIWGVSDFLGGFKNRTIPILTVLIVSHLAGLVAIVTVVTIRGESLNLSNTLLIYSVFAGVSSAIALGCLYRAMAVGPIFIVAPIAATGTVLPVIYGFLQGDNPSGMQLAGILVAMVAVVLVSFEKQDGVAKKRIIAGAGYAVAASIAIGFFFITFDIATDENPWWGTLLTRSWGTLFIILVILAKRTPIQCKPAALPALIAIGVFDIIAETLFAVASTTGMLSIVTVIASLWPATTVILGGIVLRERLNLAQSVGVLGALAGIALIHGG